MKNIQTALLSDIDKFLEESGLSDTYIGKKACNNSELVKRLRDGGRIWPETEQKLRAWMLVRLQSDRARKAEAAKAAG